MTWWQSIRAGLLGRVAPASTSAASWPAEWREPFRDPRAQVRPEALAARLAALVALDLLPPPPEQEEADAWIAWGGQVGALPSKANWAEAIERGVALRRGGIEVFASLMSASHQLQLDVQGLVESIEEQKGGVETAETWHLVASDGATFWYQDPRALPRLRLLALRFDYDHQHISRELCCAGQLLTEGVDKALPASPPSELPPGPPFEPHSLPLDADALALVAALDLIGHSCEDADAARVAGVGAASRAWAVLQLEAAGLVRKFVPPAREWVNALERTQAPAPQLEALLVAPMRERLAEREVAPLARQ